MSINPSTPDDMHIIVGSVDPLEQSFDLSNSIAVQNSDDGYCGDYQCSMTDIDQAGLSEFFSGTFYVVSGSANNKQWQVSLPASEAT